MKVSQLISAGIAACAAIAGVIFCAQSSAAPEPVHAGSEKKGMIWIAPGTFSMGSDSFPDSQPIHKVSLDGFWIDKTEVTNAQFAKFVKATGYVTIAEQKPNPADYPGTPPEKLVPGALVFTPSQSIKSLNNAYAWWQYVAGANWKHPQGPDSHLKGRWNHPVVQVAWDDAVAYAKWAGKRLPTEAEYEFAARGGLEGKKFSWGDQFKTERQLANLWQGLFPSDNTCEDGYRDTAPVGSFPKNGYGLADMTGNVWEWCSDWYRPEYYKTLTAVTHNPQGPADSFDPGEPGARKKVQKGGSFLCTDQYCARYIVGSRGKSEISTGCQNVGFRCVRDTPP